jgi:hypothetical protein
LKGRPKKSFPYLHPSIILALIRGNEMQRLAKMRLFQKAATGIMITFFGLMALVVVKAYSRRTGSLRHDFSQAQFVRKEALLQKKQVYEATLAEEKP